ncbi:MAG: MFS transporter [Chthoniobacterales bacterium]
MPTAPLNQSTSLSEDAVYAKIAWRLIPFLFLCYIAAYLDRVNVGFAKLQMQADLNFSDTVYGFAAGIFFIGYFLFEVPSNLLLERFGARLWIARIMISWGIISAVTMFAHSVPIFYLLRFLLGVAEAGFFPGIILYLTYFFPSKRRAGIVALFMMAIAVTGVIGGPISGWIMQRFQQSAGLKGWQMLFLLEGIPSIIIGFVVPFWLPNGIRSTKWLDENEREILERNIRSEEAHKEHLPLAKVFTEPRVFLFCLIYFCCAGGLYGAGFWLPQIIKNTGIKDPLHIGLLTAIPYGLAAISMVLFGRSSDRTRERRWHFAVAAFLGAIGLVISGVFGESTLMAMLGLSVATIGIISTFPLFWPMPTGILAGTSAAAGIALVNSIGNLAGFVAPFVIGWLTDLTKRPAYGLYVIAAILVLGGLLVLLFVPRRLPGDNV